MDLTKLQTIISDPRNKAKEGVQGMVTMCTWQCFQAVHIVVQEFKEPHCVHVYSGMRTE